ncbi:MAG: hydroxyacid dehydrogenase [Pseudomonadota bacterium]
MRGAGLKKVIVTEPLHDNGCAILDSRADVQTVFARGDKQQVLKHIADAHGILVRTMTLSAEDLQLAPQLQVVSRHGVGCDNIDVAHCTARSIPVAIATDSNTISVVEHVIMMMLALNKRAIQYDQITRQGRFAERCLHHTSELYGKHVLIVGFGRIGKKLAPLCQAFGMQVTVADIALDQQHARAIGVATTGDFRALLPQTDYLTMHVPLDDSTRGMIGTAELAALPAHAIVINCARGGIVDEQALESALVSGAIAAAGADVFCEEPARAAHPLFQQPATIFSPHNAASTAEGLSRMASYSAQNILDAFDGQLPADRMINPTVLTSHQVSH